MKRITLLLILLPFIGLSQRSLSMDVPLFYNIALEYEQPFKANNKFSQRAAIAIKPRGLDLVFGDLFTQYFDENSVKRYKVEYGIKKYIVPLEKNNWLNGFISSNIIGGYLNRDVNGKDTGIEKALLKQNAFFVGGQGTAGYVILGKKGKFKVTQEIGLRYFKKVSSNDHQITNDSEVWAADPWSHFDEFAASTNDIKRYRLNSGFGLSGVFKISMGYQF